MAKAFDGVRVVDLSDCLSGAWAARLFGDFGADVVLAEPPEGHALRGEPPFLDGEPGVERSLLHRYANWNKRSILVRGVDDYGYWPADEPPDGVMGEAALAAWERGAGAYVSNYYRGSDTAPKAYR